MIIVQPTYFSPIVQYVGIVTADKVVFEICDNFQKQTYRNRCYIDTAQGKHLLNVPIQHTKDIKQKTADTKIDWKYDWNKLHLKTLKTAYNASPFFEFYIDDLQLLLNKRDTFLLDLNLKCNAFVMDALQLDSLNSKTTAYKKEISYLDLRSLAVAKSEKIYEMTAYKQVFDQQHGFLCNLSILDLIFMEGPNALNYLTQQSIQF